MNFIHFALWNGPVGCTSAYVVPPRVFFECLIIGSKALKLHIKFTVSYVQFICGEQVIFLKQCLIIM